jgi:hypothetical protein
VELLSVRAARRAFFALFVAAAACTPLRMTPPETGRGGVGGGATGQGGTAGGGAGTGGTTGVGGATAGAGGSIAGGGRGGASSAGAGGATAGSGGASAGSGGSTAGTGGAGGRGGTTGVGGAVEPPGLIAFWRFEEGSGTIAADSSGNGQALALSATGAAWTTGHAGGGLQVDGASGLAEIAPEATQPLASYPTKKLTLSAWINPTAAAAGRPFATAVARTHEDFLFQDFWLGLADGKPACIIHEPNWQGAVANAVATAGAWTHIACTYANSGVITLYVNGAFAGSTTSSELIGPIQTRILVGAAETDALQAFFPGAIDDVRIYNETLTPSQVQSIAH